MYQIEPYLALWYSVLEKAIEDAFGSDHTYRIQARDWILSDESSFNHVCDIIDISKPVRMNLRAKIQTISNFRK